MAKAKERKAKSVASDTLHVAFVWDMSGSMSGIWDSAIEGFNDYVRQLQDDELADTTFMSVTAFDTVFEHWYAGVPVKEIPVIGRDTYIPRGATALYDAIGNTVEALRAKIGDSKTEKVLVVVLTDGFENASKEFNTQSIKALVEGLEKQGNWTFVYLGANDPYVHATAAAMGVQHGNSAYYAATPASAGKGMSAMASVTLDRKYAATSSSPSSFNDAGLKQDFRDEEDEDE